MLNFARYTRKAPTSQIFQPKGGEVLVGKPAVRLAFDTWNKNSSDMSQEAELIIIRRFSWVLLPREATKVEAAVTVWKKKENKSLALTNLNVIKDGTVDGNGFDSDNYHLTHRIYTPMHRKKEYKLENI